VISRRQFLPLPLALPAACRRRSPGYPGYAFVALGEGRALAVVDLLAFALRRQIPLPAAPSEVIAPPGGPAVYALLPEAGLICEADSSRLQITRRLSTRARLLRMKAAPGRGTLWLLAAEPRQLMAVSLDDFQIKTRLNLPAQPFDFDLSPDGNLAAVTFGDAGLLSLVDLQQNRVHPPAPAGQSCEIVCFRPDGRQVLTANPAERRLAVISAETRQWVTSLSVAIRPRHFCFKNDGGELFVTGEGMDAVVIVSPYSTEVTETVLAGRAPGPMAVSRSPEYLFVANPPSGDVTILDVETRRVVAVTPVGQKPGPIQITPDDRYALILDQATGSVAVIRLASILPRRTRGAPLFTAIPVGLNPRSIAIAAMT
jgi:YVTN family beta-propeller protein